MVKVSILCVTYNHEDVIRDALDGFLKQKTNFDYEIIIHDDASSDGTQDVLIEYKDKYPDLFTLILEDENQVSKGNTRFLDAMFKHSKGEYIALCDGDDYWIAQDKLQLQVDYLDNNLDCALCFHPVRIHYDDGSISDEIFPNPSLGRRYDLKRLLAGNFIQTNSIMYRKQDYKNLVCNAIPNDWYLHIFHAQFGEIGFINKVMSVYRRRRGGMWWQKSDELVEFWKTNAIRHILLFENIEKLFSDNEEYLKVIYSSIGELIDRICNEVGEADNYAIATEIATTFPRYAAMAITQNVSQGSQPQVRLKKLNAIIKKLEEDNQALTSELNVRKTQLEAVLSSKSWKITEPMRKIHEKLKSEKRHS